MTVQPVRVLLIAVGLLALPFCAPAPLASQPGEGRVYESSSGSSVVPHELVLQQQAVPYDLEAVTWNLAAPPKAPFPKEPALSQKHVFRSLLQFDKDTNNAVAVIWDQPRQKFYVDLNRNLDLTDDPTGVYSSTKKGFQQVFTNVTLPVKTAAGLLPAVLDLHLFTDAQGSWAQAQWHARSLWQAKVTIGAEQWEVAAIDNLFGAQGPAPAKFLLLRPWALRTNRVSTDDATSGLIPFPTRSSGWVRRSIWSIALLPAARLPSASWNSRRSSLR